MECPICESTMEKGRLYGDTFSMKWLPYDKKLFLRNWAIGAEKLDSRSILSGGRAFVLGYKCMNCRKIFLHSK